GAALGLARARRSRPHRAVGDRARHRRDHRLLHVPAALPGLRRREPRAPRDRAPRRARAARGGAGPPLRARLLLDRGRLRGAAAGLRRLARRAGVEQPGQLPALGRAPERAPRRALDRAAARARRDRSRRARHRAGLAALRRAAGAAGADPHQRGRAASPDREQVLRRRDLRRAARAAADRDLRPRAVPRDRRRPDRRRPRERQRPDGARDGRRRAQVPPGRPRTGLPGDDGGGRLRAARLAAGGVGDAAMDLLTGMTFLPLAAGLVLLAAGSRLPDAVWRWAGLAATTATFLLSLRLWVGFDPAQGGYQFVHHVPWIADYGINWFVGIDGMSLLLVVMTTFLMPIVLLGSWTDVTRSVKSFVFFNLALETGMLGAFVSLNLFQFYVFWEVMLIPMYFIIGIWG